jgi:antitoxin MazE
MTPRAWRPEPSPPELGTEFVVSRKPSRLELLDRLRAFRGRLPEDFSFDRDEASAR